LVEQCSGVGSNSALVNYNGGIQLSNGAYWNSDGDPSAVYDKRTNPYLLIRSVYCQDNKSFNDASVNGAFMHQNGFSMVTPESWFVG